jgi:hypothetical protein
VVYLIIRGGVSHQMVVYRPARHQRAKLFGLCNGANGAHRGVGDVGDHGVLDFMDRQAAKEKHIVLVLNRFADFRMYRLI